MPLVAHNGLPAFERLRQEGYNVLPEGRALTQDIRELHIGLLNMMQDAALHATERQFLRLIGESNQVTQIYVHLFTLEEVERGPEAKAHIEQYYRTFDEIKAEGLDALIITGTNLAEPDLSKAAFWEPLKDVLSWSWENVTSTIFACLATHAVMHMKYGQKRSPRDRMLWGIYKHRVIERYHPLVRSMNTVFDVPHSRFNEILPAQFEAAGMRILVASDEAGVHMATSADGFRFVCFQGHQEYDTISLLKEYKREITNFLNKERDDYPPFPERYFNEAIKTILERYRKNLEQNPELAFPEDEIVLLLENTWRDSGRAVIGNWIGQVYQTTNVDRHKLFMDGVDPDNPLGLERPGAVRDGTG